MTRKLSKSLLDLLISWVYDLLISWVYDLLISWVYDLLISWVYDLLISWVYGKKLIPVENYITAVKSSTCSASKTTQQNRLLISLIHVALKTLLLSPLNRLLRLMSRTLNQLLSALNKSLLSSFIQLG